MPGFDRASLLLQIIGRVATGGAEGLPEGSQEEIANVGQFFHEPALPQTDLRSCSGKGFQHVDINA